MKLLIISGFSGSGKSIYLDTLEDCGYYCLDNLPITMLEDFTSHIMEGEGPTYEKTAIGIDARNQSESLLFFSDSLNAIREKGIECEIIFLLADEHVLLKRYSETRRKHPLTDSNVSLQEAIRSEKDILNPILQHANVVIDTSDTHLYQLREVVKQQIETHEESYLSLQFQSFGYKFGVPLDADFVFDVRCLPNPYWEPALRDYSGKDEVVIDFLNNSEHVQDFLQDICEFLERWIPRFEKDHRCYLTVAIGCTGGHHRSVYLVEALAAHFKTDKLNVICNHRELN